MKTMISVLIFLLVTAGSALAHEARTFYNVCESNGKRYVDLQRDTVTVKTLTDDLVEFTAVGTLYTAKKIVDFNMMEGRADIFSFYAKKVDNDSFLLMQKGGMFTGFTYFHADQRRKNASDKTVRCAYDHLVSFESDVDAYLQKRKELETQKQADFDSQTKGVTTEYVKNLRSQRTDPLLEKGIRAWWKGPPDATVINPLLRTIFTQSTYEIVRNDFGNVLRKTVDAVYVFKRKSNGKCYANWRSFGYESLGGGTSGDEVKAWTKQDQAGFGYYARFYTMPGNRKFLAGSDHEVDCAPFGG